MIEPLETYTSKLAPSTTISLVIRAGWSSSSTSMHCLTITAKSSLWNAILICPWQGLVASEASISPATAKRVTSLQSHRFMCRKIQTKWPAKTVRTINSFVCTYIPFCGCAVGHQGPENGLNPRTDTTKQYKNRVKIVVNTGLLAGSIVRLSNPSYVSPFTIHPIGEVHQCSQASSSLYLPYRKI